MTTLPRGEHVAVVDRLDAQQVSMLSLNFRSRVRDLCIRSVWLGEVAADDGAGCRVLDHTGSLTDEPAECSKRWPR